MTPAQRAYEPAPSNDRALRKLSAEFTRLAGGRVTAEGVGSWRAPGNDRGTRADAVLSATSRAVLDRAVAEMVRRGYSVLGVREDDGEAWAWLAGGPEAAVAAVPAVEPAAVARKTPTMRTTARRLAVRVLLSMRSADRPATARAPVRPPIRARVERGPPRLPLVHDYTTECRARRCRRVTVTTGRLGG